MKLIGYTPYNDAKDVGSCCIFYGNVPSSLLGLLVSSRMIIFIIVLGSHIVYHEERTFVIRSHPHMLI